MRCECGYEFEQQCGPNIEARLCPNCGDAIRAAFTDDQVLEVLLEGSSPPRGPAHGGRRPYTPAPRAPRTEGGKPVLTAAALRKQSILYQIVVVFGLIVLPGALFLRVGVFLSEFESPRSRRHKEIRRKIDQEYGANPVIEKRCGGCGRRISPSTSSGDWCPYCSVEFR